MHYQVVSPSLQSSSFVYVHLLQRSCSKVRAILCFTLSTLVSISPIFGLQIKFSIWNEPSACDLLLVILVISWICALLHLTKLIFKGFSCCLTIFCWMSILDWLPWGSELCLPLSSRYLLPDHCEHGSVYPSMHITNFPLNAVQFLARMLRPAICSWYLLGGVDNVLIKMTAMSVKCVRESTGF